MESKTPSSFSILLLSMLAVFYGYSCLNMFLPAIPHLSHVFDVNLNQVKLTVSYFLISLSISQLFWGISCEHLSRKHALLISTSLGILGSVITAFSNNIEVFALGRVIEALGAGSAMVYARLALADYFHGSNLQVNLSAVVMLAAIVPGVAPVIGGHVMSWVDWRAIFVVLIIIGIILI
jgi:DHA1 family bicyclomycin/chloramphenicol resistance-like MFS transporter